MLFEKRASAISVRINPYGPDFGRSKNSLVILSFILMFVNVLFNLTRVQLVYNGCNRVFVLGGPRDADAARAEGGGRAADSTTRLLAAGGGAQSRSVRPARAPGARVA